MGKSKERGGMAVLDFACAAPVLRSAPEMVRALESLVAFGQHAAQSGYRPSVTTDGVWLVTGPVDRARALFDLCWRVNLFRGFRCANERQGDACAAFTLGYLAQCVGMPSVNPVSIDALIDALAELAQQDYLVGAGL